MIKRLLFNTTFVLALSAAALGQDTNTATTPAAPAQGQPAAAGSAMTRVVLKNRFLIMA